MKIFISMPMNGKSYEEIAARQNEIAGMLKNRFPESSIEIIDSFVKDKKKSPVWCLGYSIMAMNDAELVVFDKGWRKARGCKIEFDICSYYGFKFMEI